MSVEQDWSARRPLMIGLLGMLTDRRPALFTAAQE